MSFSGKRVLVTGGSRGIGRATAQAFREAGARVAVNGRTHQSTAEGIAALGGAALGDDGLIAAPGDVATVPGCEAMVGAAIDALGGLDVLVNSAGVAKARTIDNCDEALWDRIVDINLKGTFFCIRAALPALRMSRGNIVNVASESGLVGNQNMSIYCASKGGVVLMTQALSLEFAPDVRINCVCPGYVDTDMVRRDYIDNTEDPEATLAVVEGAAPMARMAKPEEIAASILYLASDAAGFVTGAALAIDGGSSASR